MDVSIQTKSPPKSFLLLCAPMIVEIMPIFVPRLHEINLIVSWTPLLDRRVHEHGYMHIWYTLGRYECGECSALWINKLLHKLSFKAKSQFKRRSTANNVEIVIPVPNDADSPKFRTTVGSCKWVPENSTVIWTIKSFPVSIAMRCQSSHHNLAQNVSAIHAQISSVSGLISSSVLPNVHCWFNYLLVYFV